MIQKNKKLSHTNERPEKYLKYIITILIVILAVSIVFIFIRNDSFYSTNKNSAKVELETLLDSINISPKPAYSHVTDLGCKANSVGLATYTNCSLEAEQYYITADNPKRDIQSLNHYLEEAGFSGGPYNNASAHSAERSALAIAGEGEGSALYKNNHNKHLGLFFYVEFFEESETSTESWLIGRHIKDGTIPQPKPGELLFGVRVVETYWQCNATSFFKLPCPPPPSKAN